MPYRRLIAASLLGALLCSCRGNAGQTLLPAGAGSAARVPAAVAAGGIGFTSVGPTHMSSYYGRSIGEVPESGKVNAYASDPKNPNLIYLAGGRGTGLETYSSAGIYRSTNGGVSWQPVVAGLTDPSGIVSSVVNSLWMDPNDPKTLLAATEYDGIFRTTDGGGTWRNVYRSTQATQFVAVGSTLYATSAAGVLASKDDGATWTVSLGGVQPTALGAASAKAGTPLYAGTTLGAVEVLSGGAWRKVSTLPFNPNTHTEGSTPAVHQLAVDPLDSSSLYASTNDGLWDQDLFGSTDGGKTWVAVLKRQIYNYGLGAQAIAFSIAHPHRLYVGADGAFYYLQGPGAAPQAYPAASLSVIDIRDLWILPGRGDDNCVVASDQGLDRVTNCSTPSASMTDRVVSSSTATGLARHFAIDPTATTLLVSLQDFDSFLTFDGGKTWSDTQFYEDGFNELRPNDPKACYVLDESLGLSVSTDGCHTFAAATPARKAIVPSRIMSAPIAFDPKHPLTMYLLSGPIEAPGIMGQRAVFVTHDGGSSFAKEAWPFHHAGTIVVDPRNGSHIIVSDLRAASSISTTFDGGKTWKQAKGVPPSAFWYTISISPVNGRTVLASSVDASANVYVLRSSDGGLTFTKTAIVTSAPALVGHIDADRGSRQRARGESGDDEAGGAPAAFLYSPVRQIAYNQNHTSGVADAVLTTLRGAFLSADDGNTWTRIDQRTIAHSFWGIRWLGGYLYIGSDGQGLLRSNAPVQTP